MMTTATMIILIREEDDSDVHAMSGPDDLIVPVPPTC